jgi:aspartyl-tRNA(Asn)/glutamyl-tRNA(Gln) amidotransferase subunit B
MSPSRRRTGCSRILRRAQQAGQGSVHQPHRRRKAGQLLALVGNGTISGSIAKQVLEKMFETGDDAATIVDREGLKQTSDTGAIEAAVATILANNADKVEQYKAGKEALFGFFVGQTMKAMAGKANPQIVNELVKKALA